MKEFFTKYWKQIAIAVVIIIVVVVIYYYGKKSASVQQVPLPQDDPNSPTPLTESEKQRIREIAKRLHADMDSWWVSAGTKARDVEAYNYLITASDTKVVAVYNDFNTLYFADSGETLTEWLEGEFFVPTGTVTNETKNAILKRFAKLNLK